MLQAELTGHKLQTMAQPKQWPVSNGHCVEVDTPFTTRWGPALLADTPSTTRWGLSAWPTPFTKITKIWPVLLDRHPLHHWGPALQQIWQL